MIRRRVWFSFVDLHGVEWKAYKVAEKLDRDLKSNRGYMHTLNHYIVINASQPDDVQACTAIHEILHVAFGASDLPIEMEEWIIGRLEAPLTAIAAGLGWKLGDQK